MLPWKRTGPDVALDDGAGRTPAARFARRHGFLHPPELVRFRILDPEIPALGGARDITVTAEAFSTLRLPVHTVIATENQVNFLALPERPGTLALYGAGYGFSSLRDAAWLRECEVLYWGDIDTHGFRILDQLRAVHPHVASVLMDKETLLAHREAWGAEPSPSRAALTRLTSEERALYESLGDDTYGPSVRLEQELINAGAGPWSASAPPVEPVETKPVEPKPAGPDSVAVVPRKCFYIDSGGFMVAPIGVFGDDVCQVVFDDPMRVIRFTRAGNVVVQDSHPFAHLPAPAILGCQP
jgi:hypothetical protein